jgi:hypothetical protein
MSKILKNDLDKLRILFKNSWIHLNEKELLEEAISLLNLTKLLLSVKWKNYENR